MLAEILQKTVGGNDIDVRVDVAQMGAMDGRVEKPEVSADAEGKRLAVGHVRPGPSNLQVHRPDTTLFATLHGLQMQSGVTVMELRRLVLKELTDNALDAGDAVGRPGAEIEKLGRNRYRIEDQGEGVRGTPEQLAALFALDRPMISGKFWRLPERGALGNGLRIIIGYIAATGGTIEVTSQDRRVLLRPLKNGRTEIIETSEVTHPIGTRIIVTFGSELPLAYDELSWSEAAIAISRRAGPPYARATSPHWMDAEQLHGALSFMQPPETTVRQFVERLDGCAGARAGKIAAPFGKNRTCQSMSEADAAQLLAAMQAAVRPVKPQALGLIGMDAYDPDEYDYERQFGSFMHGAREPQATIPFIVEVWVTVTDHKGDDVEIVVLANRTPIVADVSASRTYSDKTIALSGAGLGYKYDDDIQVKLGACSIVIHITAPFIPLLSLGKLPDLSVFEKEINEAIRLAFNRSRRRLPPEPGEPRPEAPPRLEKPEKPPPFEPIGHLGRLIKVESEVSGLSINDLTVLSASNDPYRFDNAKGHELGGWFAHWKASFLPDPDAVVHLRGLHYMLVARGDVQKPDGTIYTNTDKNWVWLQSKASKAARWLGYVPFECIKDQRADPPVVFDGGHHWDGMAVGSRQIFSGDEINIPPLLDLLPGIRWSRGKPHRQPFRIVFIGEKSSLSEVLHPIAVHVRGELFLGSDESSESHVSEIAARAAADGRPLVVLYFSDFDPSGHQMAVSVARKIQAHVDMRYPQLRAQLHHVALTLDQVTEYNLPSTPLKETEKRAERWREAMEREQTEIDALAALRPDVLRQVADDAVRPFFDDTLDDRVDDLWNGFEAEAYAWFEALPAYAKAKADIARARAELETAAKALADAQKLGLEALTQAADEAADAPEPPEDDIEPEITEPAPEPLFTTEDSFVDASKKLIARKRLVEEDEEPLSALD